MRLLTRESAAQQGRKQVSYEAIDGETYDFEIRRLGADELITCGVIPADSVLDDQELVKAAKTLANEAATKAERAKAAKSFDDRVDKQTRQLLEEDVSAKVDAVLLRGVTKPELWAGPEAECPAGAIPLSDFGQFRDRAFSDIVGFSTATKEAKAAARFPGGDEAGGAGRPNRAARRAAAHGAAG